MKISIACDHGGLELKNQVVSYLKENSYEVIDEGTYTSDRVDYPNYAKKVCEDYQNKLCDYGVLICTTGIGMSICANKFKGIRASLVTNSDQAFMTRQHNDANIICMGARYTSIDDAKKYLDLFFHTEFLGGRHEDRVNLIKKFEER